MVLIVTLCGHSQPEAQPTCASASQARRGQAPWPTCAPLAPRLELALVKLPGAGAQVLKQGALVREGEMEGEVASILPVPHLHSAGGRISGPTCLHHRWTNRFVLDAPPVQSGEALEQ